MIVLDAICSSVKLFLSFSFAPTTNRFAKPRSFAIRITALAMASVSLGITSNPVSSSSIISTTPPTFVATTGTPDACASKITRPKASCVIVDRTRISVFARICGISRRLPRNSTWLSIPKRRASNSNSCLFEGFSAGASPTIQIFAYGTVRMTFAIALRKNACPLSGVIRPTIAMLHRDAPPEGSRRTLNLSKSTLLGMQRMLRGKTRNRSIMCRPITLLGTITSFDQPMTWLKKRFL